MASPLPSARELGVVNVQPSLGVATRRGATGLEDEAAKGIASAAREFGAVTQHLERAQDEYDQTQAEDRYNQYQEKLNALALDPNTGWANAKGENALKPEFIQDQQNRFEEERKRIAETLKSPNAKKRFDRLSASVTLKHRSDVYKHSAKERMAYETQVFDDSMKLEKNNAWRTFGDDAAFNDSMTRVRALTEKFARFAGADDTYVQRAVQEAESGLWAHRISAALSAGDTRTAKELFGKATGSMTTEDRAKLEPKLKAMLKVTEAIEKVDSIFSKLVSTDPNAAYPAVKVDEELRKAFADNPEGLQAARSEAAHRRQAIQIQQSESNQANVASVMQMMHEKGVPLPQIMKTDEYRAMSGEQKAKLILHDESIRATRASRAHAEAGRAAAVESRIESAERRALMRMEREGAQVATMYMMQPETVKDMSDTALDALALNIGHRNALELKRFRDGLNKVPGGLANAKMDVQSFRAVISEYGYDPNVMSKTGKLTEKDRQHKDELSHIYLEVNQRIQAKSVEKKRPLELDEKEAIMREALKSKVYLDNGWFSKDREVPAIAVPREGERGAEMRERAIVPFKDIAPESVAASVAFLRANRPDLSRLTDQQIVERMRGSIERAAALARTGASREDIERLLGGPNYKPRAQ